MLLIVTLEQKTFQEPSRFNALPSVNIDYTVSTGCLHSNIDVWHPIYSDLLFSRCPYNGDVNCLWG